MVSIGLIDKIIESVTLIADGRRGLDIAGETEAGRVAYHLGLDEAIEAFTEAAASNNAEAIIQAEHAFITEENRFCDPVDAISISSLTAASESFDDALRSLSAVKDAVLYQGAELTCLRNGKYRIKGMPKDAFHLACIAHRTRLKNILTTPGINMIEKAIYKQRSLNRGIAQKIYIELQKKVLTEIRT